MEDVVADGPPARVYDVVRHVEPNRALLLFADTHLGSLVWHGCGTAHGSASSARSATALC